jgi:hypothetical protein
MAPLTLSHERARRSRVRAQLLDGRPVPQRGVAEVAWHLVGIQAQDRTAAGFSIRARGTGVVAADIRRALTERRSLVLLWSLRGTRHYHHADDVRWLLPLLGPVFGRPGRRAQQLGIAGDVGDTAVRAVRQALTEDGPLTRSEVKEVLAGLGIDTSGQAPVHVLHRAGMAGILCIVPGWDGEERYVLLDDWVPAGDVLAPEAAAAELARRYLAAYGPATPADFAAWSGLGRPVSRRAWAAIAGELSEVGLPAGPAWILASRRKALAPSASHVQPMRLVGAVDTLILGYADRSLHVAPVVARNLNPGGGMIHPVAVADGAVVATWKYQRSPERVEVTPFRPLDEAERHDLAGEVADIGRFLGRRPEPVIVAE